MTDTTAVRFCRYEGEVFPASEFHSTREWGLVHAPSGQENAHTIMGDDLDGEGWVLEVPGQDGNPVTADTVGKWFATIAAGVICTLILAAVVLLFVKGAIWFWNL